MGYIRHLLISIIFSLFILLNNTAQEIHSTIVRGIISDAVSNEPLPSVYIMFQNSTVASIANDEGVFSIQTTDTTCYLKFTFVGYKTAYMKVVSGKNQFVNVKLEPQAKQLTEVIVRGKQKKRYRNKGNPAVEMIEEVVSHKPINRSENVDFLEYKKYQKILLSFDHLNPKLQDTRLMKPFRFVLTNTDSTIVPGTVLLPVYLKEDFTNFYYRKNPPETKEIVTAEKSVSFDEYIDRKTLTGSINYLYQDVDIYSNNIDLLGNQFLSPIASMAPAFYKYIIEDTVVLENSKCARLAFVPRNKNDFLFQGYMFVTLDSLYAVKKITMKVNKAINLNWVRSIDVDQEFKNNGNGWLLTKNETTIDFGISKNSFGLYGQKTVTYGDYKVNSIRTDVFSMEQMPAINIENDELFWKENRPIKLRTSEHNVYVFMDSLRQLTAFKRDMNIVTFLSLGFLRIGPVEIGPTMTVYSQNPIEGSRLKLGIRTNRKFNRKLFLEANGAYGFKDQRFKTYLNAVYSLNDRTIREFPLKSIGISFQHDLKIPGEELQYAQSDNVLLSFKRGLNDKMYFNRTYRIEHINEFVNHFSYTLAYEYREMNPAGNLYFNTINYSQYANTVDDLDIGQLSLDLRYAPHEKFVQGSMYRAIITSKYPIFELKLIAGNKFLGSDYNFQNVLGSINKRFYLSVFGYTDIELEGGKIFGHVSYPLLDMHRANQTYSYQPLSYNLMNFLEFASDQYVALNVDHNFNGFFFNKVPLLKKLKFREAITFKGLYGSLSNINNPAFHTDLYKLPAYQNGDMITYTLEKKPYVEVGFGVTNIFKVFRVDYVQRVTYLDHPNISKWGIRVDYKFEF